VSLGKKMKQSNNRTIGGWGSLGKKKKQSNNRRGGVSC
jgi:hypothetical protein